MSDQVLKRQSLADQVANAILAMIVDQGLRPGTSLPSTGELAERFAVSRTVIREALADLAGRGVIERSQGRESVVSVPGSHQLQELLSSRVRGDAVDAAEIMEFRQSIEVQAARLAASRRTDEDMVALQQAWDRLAAAKTESEFHESDIGFHRAVASASGNTLILLVHDALVEVLRDVRRRSFRGRKRSGISLEGVVADHKRILEAIRSANADDAAAAMSRHLAATVRDLSAASA
jgi:GntR family transcriptional repressor for pyruvate dehydrogenase complex